MYVLIKAVGLMLFEVGLHIEFEPILVRLDNQLPIPLHHPPVLICCGTGNQTLRVLQPTANVGRRLTANKVEYMGGDGGSLAHCFVSMYIKCIRGHRQAETDINLSRSSRITHQFLQPQ
jgi:hypothetical protein